MSPAPIATGRSDPTPSLGRASPMSRMAASARATAAPRWLGATCPAATAAVTAPMASRLLRPTSAHRHETLDLLEGLLADELACAQVVDRREPLLVP